MSTVVTGRFALTCLMMMSVAACNAVTGVGERAFAENASPSVGADADPDGGDAAEACAPNACGGCATLIAAPGDACCGGGTYLCDGTDALKCANSTGSNACGGCGALANAPGSPCGGACSSATYACDTADSTKCVDPVVTPAPGSSCGTCGTLKYACSADKKSTVCSGDDANACGGCTALAGKVGDACCGGGKLACDGKEALKCSTTSNACGGCSVLANAPGTSCGGKCGSATYQCSGLDATTCVDPVTTPAVGTACGTCKTLKYACAADNKSTACPGDDAAVCAVGKVLVYYDASFTDADAAVTAAGGTPRLVATGSAFNTAFDAGDFKVIVWEAPNARHPTGTTSRLATWINSGGRIIYSHYALDLEPTLSAALGVTATQYAAFRRVYVDATNTNFWSGTQSFPSPLTGYGAFPTNGVGLTLTGAGFFAGRYTTSTTSSEGAISVTRGGRAIVNGFLGYNMETTDNDSDGVMDYVELLHNQLIYVAAH